MKFPTVIISLAVVLFVLLTVPVLSEALAPIDPKLKAVGVGAV